MRAYESLKTVTLEADVKCPERITSVQIRKYTATMTQVNTWLHCCLYVCLKSLSRLYKVSLFLDLRSKYFNRFVGLITDLVLVVVLTIIEHFWLFLNLQYRIKDAKLSSCQIKWQIFEFQAFRTTCQN